MIISHYRATKDMLLAKFIMPELKEKRLVTGDAFLIEGNKNNDNIRASALTRSARRKLFKTNFDRIIIEVRSELQHHK